MPYHRRNFIMKHDSRLRSGRLCGLRAMKVRRIAVLVSGGLYFPVLGAWFPVFRVFVCSGGVQVMVTAPRAIMFSLL
jgi:hypothetical protein